MRFKIGTDMGGTFTDFLLPFEDGTSKIHKVLFTPDDPSIATMAGLGEMARDILRDVEVIVHGTTVTTNAVLTCRGAMTGLVTTKGVRDDLEMRRDIRELMPRAYLTVSSKLLPSIRFYDRVSILQRRFKSITEEMSSAPAMTNRSPILSFPLAPVCHYIIDYFGDEFYPDDVFSYGNQNYDAAVYGPIFYGQTLVARAACKGHQAEIGDSVQCGYTPQATVVRQKALRIPPVKVYEKGRLRKDVWDLFFAEIRLDILAEDMRSEIRTILQ